ncbi:MAG: hypothetical protein ACLGI9_15600 [Thermoanaerobaculia bacterium]
MPRTPSFFTLLPLTLLAAMVVLGLFLEATIYDTLLWKTKIPLAVLLLAAFVRRSRSGAGR